MFEPLYIAFCFILRIGFKHIGFDAHML